MSASPASSAARSPGRAPRGSGLAAAGFTLLEVMVVLVIIAIIATMAMLSMPRLGGGSALDEQMRRLTSLIDLASEEALLQGVDLGLRVEPGSYRFLRYDNDLLAWAPVEPGSVFRERAMPEGFEMQLVMEGRDVLIEEPEQAEQPLPQVLIFASGELTPFELTLASEQVPYRYLITGLPFGGTEVDIEEFGL